MATQFVQYPQPTLNSGPAQYVRNGVNQSVTEDTVTPANSRPLPVKVLNASGATADFATEATLAGLSAKFGSLGQKAMTGSAPVVIASDQSAVPVSGPLTDTQLRAAAVPVSGPLTDSQLRATAVPVSGPLTDTQLRASAVPVSGPLTDVQLRASAVPVSAASLPLPAGAATETTLAGLSAKFGTLGQKLMAGSAPVVIASDQSAIPASQSGTWSVRNQDGVGNDITSSAVGALRALHVKPLGYTVVATARRDYSTGSVTTGAWVELIPSLGSQAQDIEIFDSSGQTLEIGTGAAASEARLFIVMPGGNGRIPVRIASGTRISIRAVSGTANVGEICINLYGT
jgi:hypothetical protein